MKYIFTYKIINLINNKTYIGVHSTNDLNDGYFGSGVLIKKAVKKYGIENFKMTRLKFFDNIDEAYIEESKLVTKECVSDNNTYNITTGGKGGFYHINSKNKYMNRLGQTHTEVAKNKISNALKKYKKTEAHCKNIGDSLKGRNIHWKTNTHIYTNDERNKISESVSGINNPMYGKKHSVEVKLAQSLRMKQYYQSNNNYWKGKVWEGDRLENLKKSLKFQPKTTCEYCGKITTNGNYSRWHGKNCKENK
jgi:hypothetical protein